MTRGLLTGVAALVSGQIRPGSATRLSAPGRYLGKLGKPLAGLLEATAVAGEARPRDADPRFPCASAAANCARSWSRRCEVRRSCRPPTGPLQAWTRSRACVRRASASSSHGRCAPRTTGRSRGATPAAVNCASRSCKSLGDGSRRTLEWPLAEARRKHIRQSIRAAELPVRHQTLRAGQPVHPKSRPGLTCSSNASGRRDSGPSPTWPGSPRTGQPPVNPHQSSSKPTCPGVTPADAPDRRACVRLDRICGHLTAGGIDPGDDR